MRLFWQLHSPFIEGGVLVFLALLPELVADKSTLWGLVSAFLAASLIAGNRNGFAQYRAISLSSTVWNRDQKIIACLRFLAFGASAALHSQWWPLAIAAVGLIIRLVISPRPQRTTLSELLVGSDGDSSLGRFSPRPLAQAVYRPQLKMWAWTWVAYCLVTAGTALTGASRAEQVLIAFVVTAPWVLVFGFGTMRDSLREYVILGGTRAAWAQATILNSAVGIIVALVASALFALANNDLGMSLIAFALLLPCAVTLLEFMRWRNVYVVILFLVGAGLVTWSWIVGTLAAWIAVAGLVVLYGCWALLLPLYIRQADAFGKGIAGWMGLMK
ncbi:hypothetical protein [Corynebacterium flavescens]|uniref:hypothetical protein n=1 Tax=Corynebacterium flavescens TaxID=28028 RepID=UPI00264800DB|nr:hypothetical protein [Corynebacterium flavescens]MDN6199040.1 hypothetical protein [Corynebacterium flavescens]MDN6225541.1 hypothetical protein [Corynebacterium flavescens]